MENSIFSTDNSKFCMIIQFYFSDFEQIIQNWIIKTFIITPNFKSTLDIKIITNNPLFTSMRDLANKNGEFDTSMENLDSIN